jgi:thiosulfate/3-mercaptopyruvate sulfurtransferase
MYRWIVEMGENFTGVKNQKLTRLAGVLAAVVAVVVAADLALVQPPDLAAQLAAKGVRPAVFMVGPNVLYRSKHIPGSVFAGPGREEAGLAMLKAEAGKLPRDREVVLYCGCCPWDRCPNVKPAAELLKQMGFTKVKTLYLATGFKADWLDKGYEAEQ